MEAEKEAGGGCVDGDEEDEDDEADEEVDEEEKVEKGVALVVADADRVCV